MYYMYYIYIIFRYGIVLIISMRVVFLALLVSLRQCSKSTYVYKYDLYVIC